MLDAVLEVVDVIDGVPGGTEFCGLYETEGVGGPKGVEVDAVL